VDGKFDFETFDWSPTTIHLIVEDVDGPEKGGEYDTQTVERELVQENFAPADGWDGRNTEWVAGLKIDFALKLKPEETDESNENE
jgi:hypothetical protein